MVQLSKLKSQNIIELKVYMTHPHTYAPINVFLNDMQGKLQ